MVQPPGVVAMIIYSGTEEQEARRLTNRNEAYLVTMNDKVLKYMYTSFLPHISNKMGEVLLHCYSCCRRNEGAGERSRVRHCTMEQNVDDLDFVVSLCFRPSTSSGALSL